MKVAICTLCINDWYQEIVKYGVQTVRDYAKKHGYDFHLCNDVYEEYNDPKKNNAHRDFPWYKILALQRILPRYDLVLWIDADGFIMRPELSIDHFLKTMGDKDILCTRDNNNPLNTAFLLVKNTPFVFCLLYQTWNNAELYDPAFHEQASMGEIYNRNGFNSKNKIEILPWEQHNALYCYYGEYHPNVSFFYHAARCSHNRLGFVSTLDLFCPIKMDEDLPGEYEERLDWLSTNRCRKDIESWFTDHPVKRRSTRSILYEHKYPKRE